MKKHVLVATVLIAGLMGCTDDKLDNGKVDNPVQTGEEVMFGSSLSGDNGGTDARTVYGDERTPTGIPVYWKEAGDKIAIFCAQASGNPLTKYWVYPQEGANANKSSTVAKVNMDEAGLQWGTEDLHKFYGFYPADAVKNNKDEDQYGRVRVEIPVNQPVMEWREDNHPTLASSKNYYGLPNMDLAYMYAYKEQKKSDTPEGTPIELEFQNLVTVLDITLQGPDEGSVTVTNINVTSLPKQDGTLTPIAGDFYCYIRAGEDETGNSYVKGECEPIPSETVLNTISIPCYDQATKSFITLNAGETMVVKAYLIPDEDPIEKQTIQIAVATVNGGAKRKTLQTADIVPHKVNRVLLPKLRAGEPDYWMTNLDENIYIDELSIPGSKFSYLTEKNKASQVYQHTTLEEQLKDGVRAFIFQSGAKGYYDADGNFLPDEENELAIAGAPENTLLRHTLDELAQALNTIESDIESKTDYFGNHKVSNEFVVLVLTMGGKSTSYVNNPPARWKNDPDNVWVPYEVWMDVLTDKLADLAQDETKRIYTGEITPNTTIADVRGKIVIKVNYNFVEQEDWGLATENKPVPALFAQWVDETETVGLKWGTPKGAKANEAFKWMYHEQTGIDEDGQNIAQGAISLDRKKQEIISLFDASISQYQESTAHNYWFMNDCGGAYCTPQNGQINGYAEFTTQGVVDFTNEINPYVVDELQKRTANASLGLVFMNYADRNDGGQNYKSDWLISTIIDNNFKFALRKADSPSPQNRSEYVTRAVTDENTWDE